MAVNCPSVCGHCLGGNWKRHSTTIFGIVYLLIALGALGVTIWETYRMRDVGWIYFWFIGGVSVQIAIAVSLWNIFNHFVYYVKPSLQKYIVRMIGIVPAHSINCWFSIHFTGSAIYLDTIRNFYQALVIYSFMSLLLVYLNENFEDLSKILKEKPRMKPRAPFCCFRSFPNKRLLTRCRAGVLNYTIIHPILTIVTIICEVTGNYVEGSFVGMWLWISIIDGISQVWAMYCMMLFYNTLKDELRGMRPIGKLVTVQLTIFGSFFQSFIVNIIVALVNPTLNPDWGFDNIHEFSRFILDFMLCIELSLSAVGHLYSFPYTDFKYLASAPQNFCKSIIACCSVSDVASDIANHLKKLTSKRHNNLVDQIEYDEHDGEPEVELDGVAVVRRDESSNQDVTDDVIGLQTPDLDQTTDDQNGILNDGDAIDQNKNDNDYIVGDPQKHVRHDSGSYSTSGDNGGGLDDGVVNDDGVGGVANSNGADGVRVDVSVHEIDLGMQTIAVIDGISQNVEYDV